MALAERRRIRPAFHTSHGSIVGRASGMTNFH
jgi:hypothetical protein